MKLKTTIIILILILFTFNAISFAAGVKPLVVDINAKPGATKDFELKLTPGSQEEKVKFSLYQLVQLTNGSLTYQKATKETCPAANWIKLEKTEVTVYPGEKVTVSGTVKVPFSAAGSNTVVIMVKPQKASRKKNGVKFMVRYAVRVNIRVDKPGVRSEIELKKFKLASDEENKPQIKALIANPSKLDYLVSAEATVRDAERRLVERITLKSPKGNKAQSNKTRMYPGSKVTYLGKITKSITPGKYKLRVFLRYAGHRQLIKAKDFEIKKGQFDLPSPEELGAFTVKPKKINLKLSPGAYKSKLIRLNSENSSDVKVIVAISPRRKDYSHSLANWLKVRGRKKFKLRARKRGQLILTTVVPKKVKAGSYHGHILLKALNLGTDNLISKKKVPVTVVIGDKHEYKLKTKSLQTKRTKKGYLLSLDVLNHGDIFATPQAKVIIKNAKDKFVERVKLTTVEAGQKILPKTSHRLQGRAKKLTPGKYKAVITLQQQGQELKKQTINFTVEE